MEGLLQRALADLVDHAARRVLAEQHRGRALEHVDALQAIGFDLGPGLGGVALEAIAEHAGGDVEATDRDRVETLAGGGGVGLDPGGVAQCLVHRLHLLGVHLIAGDHGNRLGNFTQRGIGLGPAEAAPGHVAALLAGRRVDLGGADHAGVQGQAVVLVGLAIGGQRGAGLGQRQAQGQAMDQARQRAAVQRRTQDRTCGRPTLVFWCATRYPCFTP